jgi:hypothetical protein
LLLLALAPAAQAASYSNPDGHYSFVCPEGWALQAFAGADAQVVGPSADGFAPNIVAIHGPENGTQDTAAWLLNYTRSAFEERKLQVNLTVVQAARVFITSAGRRAGDYVYDWVFSNLTLRQRQVIFVSPHFGLTYALTFSELASDDANRSADWAQAVDSFVVSGENVQPAPPAAPDPLIVPLIVLVACAGVFFSVAFVVTRRRRAGNERAAAAALHRRAAQAQAARPSPTPPALSRAPPGGYTPAPPARAPPVPPRPVAAPKAPRASPSPRAIVPPSGPSTNQVPLQATVAPTATAVSPPEPGQAKGPVEVDLAKRPAAGAPAATGAKIRCPKCKTQFAGPSTRPAAILCPNCGTRGTIR